MLKIVLIVYTLVVAYVYILKCSDGSYYTGSTKSLLYRINQHILGYGSRYTFHRKPVELVFVEEFDNIKDAYRREKQIQGWSRKKKEALIERSYDCLIKLSKSN